MKTPANAVCVCETPPHPPSGNTQVPAVCETGGRTHKDNRPRFAAVFVPLPGHTMDVRRMGQVLKAALERHGERHGFKCIDVALAGAHDERPALTAIDVRPVEAPRDK